MAHNTSPLFSLGVDFPTSSELDFPLLAQTSVEKPAPKSSAVSAASLLANSKAATSSTNYYKTLSPPINDIIGPYLMQGYGLQISGPPGACVERLVLGFVKSVTSAEREVVFVDMQNKVKADTIDSFLSSDVRSKRVFYRMFHKLPEVVELLATALPEFLYEHQNVSLLVLSSLSFPFQAEANFSVRNATLDRVREMIVKLCKQHDLLTIVTTTMTTHFLKPDGSRGKFGDDTIGVLSPQIDLTCKSISSLIVSRKDHELGCAVFISEAKQVTRRTNFSFVDLCLRDSVPASDNR